MISEIRRRSWYHVTSNHPYWYWPHRSCLLRLIPITECIGVMGTTFWFIFVDFVFLFIPTYLASNSSSLRVLGKSWRVNCSKVKTQQVVRNLLIFRQIISRQLQWLKCLLKPQEDIVKLFLITIFQQRNLKSPVYAIRMILTYYVLFWFILCPVYNN